MHYAGVHESQATLEAKQIAASIRRTTIEQSQRAHVGHIGSALSIAEILGALFAGPLADVRPDDQDRHRFILSKGHAALALYGALYDRARITRSTLDSYCSDGGALAAHPEHVQVGIDFSTGSLGHGLSLGAGAALAARLQRSRRCAFVLMSDAELNEGSVWEAAMFAAHHRLCNLIAVVDVNGQQALGYTQDVLALEPLEDKWRSFGWDVRTVGGHEVDELLASLSGLDVIDGAPHVLLARTVFGKGVSFMERRIEWHYLPLAAAEYSLACRELDMEEL
jgi:transketolase